MIQDNQSKNDDKVATVTVESLTAETEQTQQAEESEQVEESKQSAESAESAESEQILEKEKVTIEFPYSELLRAQVPKTFEIAEKVATDWKNEGDFTDLGITHPMAGIVASQALQKAKDVEKKLEEKGVFSIAKVGFEIVKAGASNIISKITKN